VRLGQPDWGENSHSLAFELVHSEVEDHLHVLLNAYWEPLEFELPRMPEGRRWARLIDTARPSPADFCEPAELLPEGTDSYPAAARSAVVLIEQGVSHEEVAS
jgi:glycogen operon protein